MAKREDLLKNLRQADKRRQRRPQGVAPVATRKPVEAELLGQRLLELYQSDPELTDRQVATAAQHVLLQRPSNDPKLRQIQNQVEDLIKSPQTDRMRWRQELSTLVESLRNDFTSGGPRAFFEYLRTLST